MEPLTARDVRAIYAQHGVALIIVLVMLAAMAIAGIALVRVVDSANVISGNFAFRQATLNIADLGTEAAVAELTAIRAKKAEDKPYPPDCTTACRYFPARSDESMVNAKGLPIKGSIDGAATENVDWSGSDVNVVAAGGPSGYSIRYVIDRQCTVAPVTDAIGQCITETPQSGGSKKAGATVFTPASSVYYRVSIQVTGPRRTQSHVQVILVY